MVLVRGGGDGWWWWVVLVRGGGDGWLCYCDDGGSNVKPSKVKIG